MYNHGLLKFGSLENTLHLIFQPTLKRRYPDKHSEHNVHIYIYREDIWTKLSKHTVHILVGLEREFGIND